MSDTKCRAQDNTWLLINLTPTGAGVSLLLVFLFFLFLCSGFAAAVGQ